jgi:signal transduction histidine kinase
MPSASRPRRRWRTWRASPRWASWPLSISRSIVERHGGRLWATANPEHGVTFHVQLPGVE